MTLHPDLERLALLGWHLVPMARKTRKGLWKGYLDSATHDLEQLERWQREYPGCNWAVVPGASGLFAIDVDIAGADHACDGIAAMRQLCDLHGPLPARPHGRSGGGGHLLVFRATQPVQGGSARPAPGLDALCNRQPFTVSPSRHRRTGDAYRWLVAPWDLEPPAAPEWLLAMLAPPPPPPLNFRAPVPSEDRAVRALMRSFPAVADAPPGGRNIALLRRSTLIGGYVGAGVLGQADAERTLIDAGMAAGQSRAEATSTVRSGLRRGLERPIEWGRA